MKKYNKDETPGFLYAGDLVKDRKWISPQVEIAAVYKAGELSFANGKPTERPTLEFTKGMKFCPCGTAVKLLKMELGNGISEWVGKSVTLYVARIYSKLAGGEIPAIRIRPSIPLANVPGKIKMQLGEDLTGRKIDEQ